MASGALVARPLHLAEPFVERRPLLPLLDLQRIGLELARAAALLGVEKEQGAIRIGMVADLVATPVNPLHEIDGLKRANLVMKDGQVWRKP